MRYAWKAVALVLDADSPPNMRMPCGKLQAPFNISLNRSERLVKTW